MSFFNVFMVCIVCAGYLGLRHAIFDSKTTTGLVCFTTWAASKLIYQLFLYPRVFTPLRHLPTPQTRHWLTGNTESFLVEVPYTFMKEWLKNVPNQGLIRYYIVANSEWVFVASTDALCELLVKKAYDFEKSEMVRDLLGHITGKGVLLAEGDEHKIQRKDLMPAFSSRQIQDLHSVFWSQSVEMVKTMETCLATKINGDNVIKISDWSSRVTLDIIGKAGMGIDFDSLNNPENALNQAYRRLTSPSLSEKLITAFCLIFLHPKVIHKIPTKSNREVKQSKQTIRDAARSVIQQRTAEKETTERKLDIISVALRSNQFNEDGLINQAMTFLAAGHETTSAALQWTVYALCKHQDIQSRLRNEVRTNLPPLSLEAPEIHSTALKNLPYLNAVCNESLRLYPPIPKTVRTAVRDTSIAGNFIPKGTMFVLVPQIINRMEETWGPNAEKFDPERFMGPGRASKGNASSTYASLTFLHGPRSCIAQEFARTELAFMVAAMAGRFHMELQNPDAELQVIDAISVVPKDGVMAKLTPLDGW